MSREDQDLGVGGALRIGTGRDLSGHPAGQGDGAGAKSDQPSLLHHRINLQTSTDGRVIVYRSPCRAISKLWWFRS